MNQDNDANGEAHFSRIIEQLCVDADTADASLSPLAGGEGLGIFMSYSPDCPFDLWFDAVEEVWGAIAYSLLKGVGNLVVLTKCPSSETDATVVAQSILDAVKDFRWKHRYIMEGDVWRRESPTRCEGSHCPHIIASPTTTVMKREFRIPRSPSKE